MKTLIFLFFCLSTFSARANPCPDHARLVLSSSPQNQQRFIESGFLSKLFSELIEIIHANGIVMKNDEVGDMILQLDDDARNPPIINLFEVANVFGVNVSDLFKHYGNLVSSIDPSGIITAKESLGPEKRYRISERIHLHFSGLIEETLREKNLTLEELAYKTSIKLEVFQHMINKGIPRLHSLLQILVRLDADVVDFFKRVESGLEQKGLPRYFGNRPKSLASREVTDPEKRAIGIYVQMKRELKEIFEGLEGKNFNSDVARFKKMIYRQYDKEILHRKQTSRRKLPSSLPKILHTARILGMRPSEVLKHVGNLKPHARLDGIENRTFLNDEDVEELLGNISKHVSIMFDQSGITLEEFAKITQLPAKYLEKIIHKGSRYSYAALERILQAFNTDTIRFFEELESMGKLDVHVTQTPSNLVQRKDKFLKGQTDGQFMGERILQLREILLPIYSARELKFTTGNINTNSGQNLPERDIYFKTFYKVSRMAKLSLSELAGRRPIEDLVNPHHARVESVSEEEIAKAKRLLTHLLVSEVRRQNDVHGLTVMELAIKGHLATMHIRRTLSGQTTPLYLNLRQIVEDGLNIPLPQFLEGFEFKLKAFDNIPTASKKILLDLEGLYLSKRVKERMKKLEERIDSAIEFLKSSHFSSREISKLVGARIWPSRKKEGNMIKEQIYTVMKFCHLLGISLRDFLGSRDFSELVDVSKLNSERLSEDRLISAIGAIKSNVNQRRKSLNLPVTDLTIMLGAPMEHKLTDILNESVSSFPWYRYFQLAEVLAQDGEDDLFLLERVDL